MKGRPYIARSAAAINSRSCGRGTANAAAEMAYINVSVVLAQMHCFQLEYLLLIIIKFIYLSVLCIDRHIVSHQGLNI